MNLFGVVSNLIKPAIQGFLRWKEGEDKMEITRKDYELRMKELEADIELRMAEEMRKPDSEFRKFVMDYEGAAKDQTPFIKNLRSSVRPFITYWALIIITCVMFGWVDSDSLKANLESIPDPLWQIFLAIFGFWFGGRALMQIAETWKTGEINRQRVESDGKAAEALAKAKAVVKKAHAEKETKKAELVIASKSGKSIKPTSQTSKKTNDEDGYDWDDEFWEDEVW